MHYSSQTDSITPLIFPDAYNLPNVIGDAVAGHQMVTAGVIRGLSGHVPTRVPGGWVLTGRRSNYCCYTP